MGVISNAYKTVAALVANGTKIATYTEQWSDTLRFCADAATLNALYKNTYNATAPIFENIGKTRAALNIVRLATDFISVIDGTLWKNIKERKICSVVASVCFFLGRGLVVAKWTMATGLVKSEELVKHVSKIGVASFFSRYATHPLATAVKGAPIIDALFVVGLVAFGIMSAKGLEKRENMIHNGLNLTACVADVALGVLGMYYGDLKASTTALLGVVAAGSSVLAYLWEPQNTPTPALAV